MADIINEVVRFTTCEKIWGLIYRGKEHVPAINAMFHGNVKENVSGSGSSLAHDGEQRIVS